MKNLIATLITLSFFIQVSFATVRTVSNHSAGGAQFSTLQAAYVACAVSGDTLLVEGTDIPYFLTFNQRWEKSITVIGIGFNPQKQMPKKTKFRFTDGLGLFLLRPGAAGSRFYGIEFTSRVELETGQGAVNNLVFEECWFAIDFYIGPNTSSTGFIFTNSVFYNDNTQNFFIENSQPSAGTFNNCIFDGHINGSSSPILDLSSITGQWKYRFR